MKEERSAGAVIFRREGGRCLFLLLHYQGGHYDWPKGNIERGESELDTVRREVLEETGIADLTFYDGFRETIMYFYSRGGERIRKTVAFYLAETGTSEVKLSWEHVGYKWADFEESMNTLTYRNSREVLRKAKEFLERRGVAV